MIDGVGKAREEWDHDATLPLCAFTMRTNDAMDNRVTNLVLNSHIVDSRSILSVRTKATSIETKHTT